MNPLVSTAAAAVAGLAGAVSLTLPAHAAVASAHAATHVTPAARHQSHGHTGLVFVQDDALNGNAVHVYRRGADGMLTRAGTYATGSKGGMLGGSVVDHLASQHSLTYDRAAGLLYAVNAGSDTVTVFQVRGDRLVRRQVVSSGGDFPVSVAVHGSRVFVLNVRHGGSVAGFQRVGDRLVPMHGWHRALHQAPAPTVADQFTSSAAQVGVTPDGSRLIVTTKNGSNQVLVFRLGKRGPSARPAVTTLAGTVPYGFDFDRAGHLVLTEAGPNAVATFAVRRSGRLSELSSAATGQMATCWVTEVGGFAYASNAASGTLSRYHVDGGGTLRALGQTTTDGGTVDATASPDGRYLYVQTGAAGVVDEFRIGHDGGLAKIGSVLVPGAVGGEGIAAS
jgi:6-phosphogluconolactonase (cycloisomerase 2 family)